MTEPGEKTGEERGVDAVDRALALLECFGEEDAALSLAELSRRSGLYKSTILRLAVSLDRFGYMTRREDGRFRLGPTLWRLGSHYRRQFDLGELIRPELRALVEATGESASYYVREGNFRVCLYRLNSPRPVRHHLVEGQRFDLKAGASAKVLVAFSSAPLPQRGRLGEAATATRAAGHAISLGERDPDVASCSVPLLDTGGHLHGALTVSGLVTRFTEERRRQAIDHLKSSAKRLSAALTTFP